jgi:hypothetical protein
MMEQTQELDMPMGIWNVKWGHAQGHSDECQHLLAMGEPRATTRYQLLIQQLLAENENDQAAIARILGLTQPHVSRLKDGKRKAGIDAIELAIRKLRIAPAFFFAPMPTEPHYRDFKGIRKLAPPMGYPALYRFLKMAEDGGISITQREKTALGEQEWDGDPTPESYMLLLQALRTVQMPETTVVRRIPTEQAKGERKRETS